MKVSKEYVLIIIIGLFLLAYLLDAVVNPLDITLATPYSYLQPEIMGQYPFTTISIFIKSVGLFLVPVWLLSFIAGHHLGKASFLLVLASLVQLYALQDVVTKAGVVPLEWSLSLSVAGVVLLFQAVLFFIKGAFVALQNNVGNARMEAALERRAQETPDSDSEAS